jgi:hypothetical protein
MVFVYVERVETSKEWTKSGRTATLRDLVVGALIVNKFCRTMTISIEQEVRVTPLRLLQCRVRISPSKVRMGFGFCSGSPLFFLAFIQPVGCPYHKKSPFQPRS